MRLNELHTVFGALRDATARKAPFSPMSSSQDGDSVAGSNPLIVQMQRFCPRRVAESTAVLEALAVGLIGR